jgi:hypothetical protein
MGILGLVGAATLLDCFGKYEYLGLAGHVVEAHFGDDFRWSCCRCDRQRVAAQADKVGAKHVYEVRPRTDKRGVDLISDALPFGSLWFPDQLHTIKNRSVR